LVLLALLLAVGHQLVLSNLYLGIHAYATWCAAILGAAGLQPVAARLEEYFAHRSSWQRKLTLSILAAAAVASLLVRAPSDVRIQMVQLPGSVVAQWGAVALYDLQLDPQEEDNLIDQHPRASAYRDAFDHFVASNGLKIFAVKQ
jgi:hypothetical protein